MSDYDQIYSKLRAATLHFLIGMQSLGFSRKAIAKHLGSSESTLARFQRGDTVKIETLEKWLRVFGFGVKYELLTNTEDK